MLLILSLSKTILQHTYFILQDNFKHFNILSSFLLDHHSKSLGFLLFVNTYPRCVAKLPQDTRQTSRIFQTSQN